MKHLSTSLIALCASVGMASAASTLGTNPSATQGLRGPSVPLALGDISQMTDNAPVDGNGVACGVFGESTSENNWYRRFYFNEYPQLDARVRINSVMVASDIGPIIPVTINLYTIPHSTPIDTIVRSALVPIGSGTGTVGGELQTSTIEIPSRPEIADTAVNDLVVEYHIDGAAFPFYPGGNPAPQAHSTFMTAPTCGIGVPDPAPTETLPPPQDEFHLVMVVNTSSAVPGPTLLTKTFTPDHVATGATSTLTLTLDNANQATDAVLDSPLTDTFPAGLVVATPSNVATTCGGAADAVVGSDSISLAAGAVVPASDTCTVSVDVTAATDGEYVNTIPAGALVTQFGTSPDPATATLEVGFTFPAPYCSVSFANGVDPISRVLGMGIDNLSNPALDASPPLEDFTAIVGQVARGESVTIAVEGNTAGDFTEAVKVYVDWNHDGILDLASEGYDIGYLDNSTGTDGQQVTASIPVPASALPGQTRMRVIKKFASTAYPWPCNEGGSGWGQAEDYTLQVGPTSDGLFCNGFESGENGQCSGAIAIP